MADNVKDVSSDTKTTEKSSPLTLDKLPLDVLEKVTGWLQLVDCLVLRKVSRGLQSFVDSTERHCEKLCFLGGPRLAMTLDDLHLIIRYENMEDGGCKVTSIRKYMENIRIYVDNRDFKEAFFTDASTFLTMPKLEIGVMEFQCVDKDTGLELMQCLKTRNLLLNVRSIESNDLELLHPIQEFLKPEKLEEVLYTAYVLVNNLGELAKTNIDIMKNPKLKFRSIVFSRYSDESSAKFSEILKSINSQLNIRSVVVEDERWIPIILQSLNPEKVEDLELDECDLTVEQFNAIDGNMQWKTKTRLQCNVPKEIGLQQLVDFKEFRFYGLKATEENLIIIRDIILKSPHFDLFRLHNPFPNRYDEDEMNERIDRIMSESPEYDASTRRFSIPNSQDYFQLTIGEYDETSVVVLTIKKILRK